MYVLNKISYFNPPISPFRTESGQLYPATVVPSAKVSVEQLYRMIVDPDGRLARLTNQVRASKDYRSAKVQMLPYVTPYGVFSERRSKGLLSYSGLIPLDFDYLASEFEAQELRDWIFSDNRLDAKLVFFYKSMTRGVATEAMDSFFTLRGGLFQRRLRDCLMTCSTGKSGDSFRIALTTFCVGKGANPSIVSAAMASSRTTEL